MPADHTPDGVVTLWQQSDGRWRWRWSPSADGEPGPVSHVAFASLEEARHSAGEAYPAAELPDPAREPVRRRRHRRLFALGVLVVVAAAVRSARHAATSAGTAPGRTP